MTSRCCRVPAVDLPSSMVGRRIAPSRCTTCGTNGCAPEQFPNRYARTAPADPSSRDSAHWQFDETTTPWHRESNPACRAHPPLEYAGHACRPGSTPTRGTKLRTRGWRKQRTQPDWESIPWRAGRSTMRGREGNRHPHRGGSTPSHPLHILRRRGEPCDETLRRGAENSPAGREWTRSGAI